MNNDNFKKYAEIKKQIKDLEAILAMINPLEELKERTKDMADKNLKFEFGTFSVVERKTWEYTNAVKREEFKVKELKKLEEETNRATAIVTESLRFQ